MRSNNQKTITMENLINIEVEKNNFNTEVKIDNSVNGARDFVLKSTSFDSGKVFELQISLSKEKNNVQLIRINDVVLDGIVLELFKQFINQ